MAAIGSQAQGGAFNAFVRRVVDEPARDIEEPSRAIWTEHYDLGPAIAEFRRRESLTSLRCEVSLDWRGVSDKRWSIRAFTGPPERSP